MVGSEGRGARGSSSSSSSATATANTCACSSSDGGPPGCHRALAHVLFSPSRQFNNDRRYCASPRAAVTRGRARFLPFFSRGDVPEGEWLPVADHEGPSLSAVRPWQERESGAQESDVAFFRGGKTATFRRFPSPFGRHFLCGLACVTSRRFSSSFCLPWRPLWCSTRAQSPMRASTSPCSTACPTRRKNRPRRRPGTPATAIGVAAQRPCRTLSALRSFPRDLLFLRVCRRRRWPRTTTWRARNRPMATARTPTLIPAFASTCLPIAVVAAMVMLGG